MCDDEDTQEFEIDARELPAKKAEGKSRLTIVRMLCYQPWREQPVQIEDRFSRLLEATEEDEVYRRKGRATKDWSELDFGHNENPSIVRIENLWGTKDSDVSPSSLVDPDKCLCLSLVVVPPDKYFALVPAGESLEFTPYPNAKYMISTNGLEILYRITTFPR